MRKTISVIMFFVMAAVFTACGKSAGSVQNTEIGSSADNLHSLCTDATKWTDGKRFGSEASKETMKEWLEGIGF